MWLTSLWCHLVHSILNQMQRQFNILTQGGLRIPRQIYITL
jgi:hypothetical protein